MNREEEILNAAIDFANEACDYKKDVFFDIALKTFIKAAEWSDEHPKKGMVSINKVCDYLSKITYQEFSGGPMIRKFENFEIENLKKKMEE